MAFKVKKAKSDGRINTFGLTLIDNRMRVVEDAEIAEKFSAFGYIVEETDMAPGEYPEANYDQAPVKKTRKKAS